MANRIPGGGDGLRPVHVIIRQDIERSGMSTIFDLLVSRRAYNNFGVYRSTLLGTGSAVFMIDGRRIANPNTNYVLESLSVATVERIEFINDGAAALYAGGAAGAINIVLRHGFEGATAWVGAERPVRRGGEIENAGALWGGKVGRGRLMVGTGGFRQAEIRSRDRAYSRASWTEGGSFAGVTGGVNEAGNTLFLRVDNGTPGDTSDDRYVARSLGACSGGSYTGPPSDPFGTPGTGCSYGYADIAWETERLGLYSLFANFDRPLGKAATYYAAARFAQRETAFRRAPVPGIVSIEPWQELRDGIAAEENGAQVLAMDLLHRFTAHGNRDRIVDLLEYDVTAGRRGRLSYQQIFNLEASGQSLPAGAAVIREGNLIARIVNPLVNSGESEVSGLDIRAGARWKTSGLDTAFDLRRLHLLESEAMVRQEGVLEKSSPALDPRL